MESVPQVAVSVIVPVYRGRELFASLLADLRNQTLRNIEIICVDDRGGDGTFDIALAAAGEDPRIRCLHNETNCGPGPSRNRGIEAARGEYIGFADADDIIPPDFYRLLYDKSRQTGALVVKGRRAARHADGSITCSKTNDGIREGLARAETMLNLFTFEHTTGIYRNSLVQETGARNADARQDEDTAFLCMLMGSVPPARFALQEDAVYYYRKVETSLTHHLSASYFEESVKSMRFKLAHLMNLPDSEEVARYAANLFEERCSWRLSRMPEAPDMTEEQQNAYCVALREAIRNYLASGHVLASAGLGTSLVAAGTCARDVLRYLRIPPPVRQPLPRIARNRPPATPKEKNVAILNFAGGANYGANLTAYALARAVAREGFHPYLVNRRFLYYPALDKDARFLDFGEKHLRWTVPCYGREHYKLLNKHYDTFIVGSDQVWTYQPNWYSQPVQLRDVFDLEFTAPGKRRIAMAASFGENNYHTAPAEFCEARAKALKRFAAVSVRENSGVDICRDYLQAQAQQVLDPVFLLDKSEWKKLANGSTRQFPNAYTATCCLHEPLVPYADAAVLHLACEKGWLRCNIMEGSVQDWLQCICNSSLVITDSFHVGCFAIIFRKPVVFLVNSSRGRDRMPSLLETLGISTPVFKEEEICKSPSAFLRQVAELPQDCTDYSSLRLEPAIQATLDFLRRALHSPMPTGADAIPVDWGKIRAERRAFTTGIRKCMAHAFPRYVYHFLRGVFQKRFRRRAAQDFARLSQAFITAKL